MALFNCETLAFDAILNPLDKFRVMVSVVVCLLREDALLLSARSAGLLIISGPAVAFRSTLG
jgi:hypothetical protein